MLTQQILAGKIQAVQLHSGETFVGPPITTTVRKITAGIIKPKTKLVPQPALLLDINQLRKEQNTHEIL
jgi:hypothetical protein